MLFFSSFLFCFHFLHTDGKLTKIYERIPDGEEPLLKGPETIIIHPKDSGSIYVLTEEALLVKLSDFQTTTTKNNENKNNKVTTTKIQTAKTTMIANLGMGRPLGGSFTSSGDTLYIADAILGLLRLEHPHKYPKSKVEIVVSKVLDEIEIVNPRNGTITTKTGMTPIHVANDVVIGPKTGKVYFTDCKLSSLCLCLCVW